MTKADLLTSARRTIQLEQQAVADLAQYLNEDFVQACETILGSQGRVIVSGMGKSGHIGKKIAASLASTGTPSFFVHPGEASHGDLGMITPEDVVLALSNSGESGEIVSLIPSIKRVGAQLIAMTGNDQSTLAKAANAHLFAGAKEEACPLNLAPTSSTTAALVMGDALVVALLEARGFTAEDFAFSHPGGSLGRKLLLKVEDLMHGGEDLPKVTATTQLSDALLEITQKKLGMTTVVDDQGKLVGVFTDGDLRRALNSSEQALATPIHQLINPGCTSIRKDQLAAEALYTMEEKKITSLVILDNQGGPEGVVHMHDLLKAGVA